MGDIQAAGTLRTAAVPAENSVEEPRRGSGQHVSGFVARTPPPRPEGAVVRWAMSLRGQAAGRAHGALARSAGRAQAKE